MRFDNTDVWGFKHAIRGMRNPYDSWAKSDSKIVTSINGNKSMILGDNDKGLAQFLIKGGSEHRKFLRQIMVSVDITAPFYWWKEFDTYKVGTTANSCSTMHTLTKNLITIDCFEMGDFCDDSTDFNVVLMGIWEDLISKMEGLRIAYIKTKDKRYWKELVRLLPESWLQKRTVTMNYENLLSICRQRKGHRLTEWGSFIDWAHSLPYAEELIFIER